MSKPSTANYTLHCGTCSSPSELPEGSACPVCGGAIIFQDLWVTRFKTKLRGVQRDIKIAKEEPQD
ncbi:hypothetical protein ACU4HD_12115 [Cupriavidus basilensis]